MASKDRYEFFKNQYDIESSRATDLNRRAEIFVSLVTVFLTGILFKIKDVLELMKTLPIILMFLLALLLFAASLVTLIDVLKVRSYVRSIDIDEYFEELPDEGQTDEDFFDDRILDAAVATTNNARINLKKAKSLIWARGFILSGFLASIVFLILVIFNSFNR